MGIRQTASENVPVEPLIDWLRLVSIGKEDELDELLREVSPIIVEFDNDSDDITFKAIPGDPKTIRMGLKCSIRLEAHAEAASVIINAIGTLGYHSMDRVERDKLLSPANEILTWAVSHDLQARLNHNGRNFRVEDICRIARTEMPVEIIQSLSESQHHLGDLIFRYASSFILLHELAHLKFNHSCSTPENEKDADRFAAEWLNHASGRSNLEDFDRQVALFGIATALLWLTVRNVYFGQTGVASHPEGYDRLYQVLEHVIDSDNKQEFGMSWYFVARMLYIHMWRAGYIFDKNYGKYFKGDSKVEVNYLIDLISNWDRNR